MGSPKETSLEETISSSGSKSRRTVAPGETRGMGPPKESSLEEAQDGHSEGLHRLCEA
jgi:hypothetical protein